MTDGIDNSLRIGPAAAAIGVSVDTLRRWERAGRVTFERRGNQRYIHADEVARLLRERSGPQRSSARNRLGGIVLSVQRDGVMAQVEMACGPYRDRVADVARGRRRARAGAGLARRGRDQVHDRRHRDARVAAAGAPRSGAGRRPAARPRRRASRRTCGTGGRSAARRRTRRAGSRPPGRPASCRRTGSSRSGGRTPWPSRRPAGRPRARPRRSTGGSPRAGRAPGRGRRRPSACGSASSGTCRRAAAAR